MSFDQSVYHLFFVYEMSGLTNQHHEGIEVMRPLVKDFTWILGLREVHDTRRTIYTGIDHLVCHKIR